MCGAVNGARLPGPRGNWRYWHCRVCGHAWLVPQPSDADLVAYYNSAYQVPFERYLVRCAGEAPSLERLVSTFKPIPGRMLEVGCSYGGMLHRFARAGWEVVGVEVDARAARVAHEQFGLSVHQGTLEQARGRLSPPYDVIALFHVIEHVPTPQSLARRLRELLASGGILIIKTPNADSLAARLLAGWWEWYAAPEHVHVFSARSLRLLLEQSGFRLIVMRTRRGDAHRLLFELVRGEVKRLVRKQGVSAGAVREPARSRLWYKAGERVANLVGAPIEWLLTGMASRGWRGGPEILAVAGHRGS
jgi:SAM-dependent methyltransferase